MESKPHGDLRSILLAIVATSGAILAVLLSVLVVFSQEVIKLRSGWQKIPLFEAVVLASAILFAGALLIPAAYYSIQRLLGEKVADNTNRPMSIGRGIVLVLVWLSLIALTQVLYNNSLLRWITPPLYVASIGLPVYFFVLLASGGLNGGSRQRVWGALASGIVLGPSLAAVVELTVAVIILFGVGIYISLHPELRGLYNTLKDELSNTSNQDQILNLIAPYLRNPLVILTALAFLSGLAPLVEETAKSLTTWTIFDRIASPAQGFVVGAMSGAGFGLVESLLAAAQPDSSWAVSLFVRGGGTMMHVVTASLTGWGIGTFRATKRPGPLLGTYMVAMAVHATWNACIVAIIVGSLNAATGTAAQPILGIALTSLSLLVLGFISLVIPIALGVMNWRLRLSTPPAALHTEPPGPPTVQG